LSPEASQKKKKKPWKKGRKSHQLSPKIAIKSVGMGEKKKNRGLAVKDRPTEPANTKKNWRGFKGARHSIVETLRNSLP